MNSHPVQINIGEKIVIKKYQNPELAKKYFSLYSRFYHHARPIAVRNNSLVYHYAEGVELKTVLLNPSDELAKKSIISLAKSLAKNHLNPTLHLSVYDSICRQRRPTEKHKFITSGYYSGNIHGDLNTKNIIVSKSGKITFIDRLRESGDIMFDFTFIMSILCLYARTQNKEYLKLIDLFWRNYNLPLDDVEDFLISFRNNFVNYGNIVAEDTLNHQSFPEWIYGHFVSEEIARYKTFSEYLSAQLD